ncbi:MAG: ABC transporter ATP-binding protein [Armatimonadota bacterium]|nr:ABC transporter ATP-binding protein [Armatimonadota bacterium]MDR7438946.1 ABC transporter ATP-binding protein [Armatimonadota bacterium]MDR7562844.1 ABC transporter ATP-binding protein [Armatimonadota bacterium]MDR7567885.1 ABC transporter ATP-binding protein [Armatimonadota bacterium]MDR7601357.1 ABC transporter ATP-binding protein [Armatimonadota bacterium]
MRHAIVFDRVSKSYRRGSARYRSLRDDLVTLLTPWSWTKRREAFWALREVSFEVEQGQALGIIGPNGSGKSTTLKLIARITHPTEGTLRIRGRVGALIEVGAGIHPELTGRENIYVYGSILGLRGREIRRRFEEIVEFAEIGSFVDTPVKHYSSGMQVRLGFAVAAHMDVDVLLVDEVLAVGDAAFQSKCLRRIRELRDQGVTILLVSHQLANVQRICPQTLLLLHGRVAARGPTPEVIAEYYRYLDRSGASTAEVIRQPGMPASRGDDRVRIVAVRLLDSSGRERPTFQMGEDLVVRVEYAARERVERPQVSVSFNSSDWTVYTGMDTRNENFLIPAMEGRGRVDLVVPQLGLGPGLYEVNVGIWDETLSAPYDWRWGIKRFVVDSTRPLFAGRFVLPHRWTWQTTPGSEAPAVIVAPGGEGAAAVDRFQGALLGALHTLLNGEFVVPASHRRELLRPLDLRASRVPWDVFQPAVVALRELRGGLPHRVRALAEEGAPHRFLPFERAAQLLCALYEELDRHLEDGADQDVRVLREFDPGVYRERGMEAVVRLGEHVREALAPYLAGFYLHGSLSTLDYTPYSDLDDFLIVQHQTLLDPEQLMACAERCVEAARFLYEHDPLQHHGHFVLTELDLRRYPPAHLPPEVLPYATAVVGPSALRIRARDGSRSYRRQAERMARQLARHERASCNVWEFKDLLARVMLLPALYLGAAGEPCYKKFAFERARPHFDGAWRVVEIATELRERWSYRPGVREALLRAVSLRHLRNPVVYRRLIARYAPPLSPELTRFLWRTDFYTEVRRFAMRTLQLLEQGEG